MSRPSSPQPASENTPLLAREDDETQQQPQKKSSRLPSIIALTILCVAALLALGVGFAAPAVVEEYAKEAVVFQPENLSIESFTKAGVRARTRGTFYLDASRVERGSVRTFGKAASWVAKEVETGAGEVRVYGLDNILLGTAAIPPVKLNIRNVHYNYIDLVIDLEPGNIEGLRKIAQDVMDGRIESMQVNAVAEVPVKSGLISLGTQTIRQALRLEKGDAKIPDFDIEDLQVSEYGPPGHPQGLKAKVTISASNPYPVKFTIPPVVMDIMLMGCADQYLKLGTARTDPVHIHSKQLVVANVTGLVEQLPTLLTKACPDSNKSPLDTFVGAYLQGDHAKIYARGGQQNSKDTPEWIGNLLQDIVIGLPVPSRPFDKLIKSFSLSSVNLQLPKEDDREMSPKLSAIVMAIAEIPSGIDVDIDIDRVRADADVYYNDEKLGELDLHQWQEANSTKHGHELWLQSRVVDAPLNITNDTVFAEVVRKLVFGGSGLTLGIKTKVDVSSTTALGQFVIRKIPTEGEIFIKPLGGDFKYDIKSIEPIKSDSETLTLEAKANAHNPTNYTAQIPFMNVTLWCNGTQLGNAWGSFDIKPGKNHLTAYASYNAGNMGREFLSQYLSGRNVTISVRTHEGSVPGLPTASLVLDFVVPHVFGRFLQETTMHIISSTATFVLSSPVSLYITTIAASAFYNGTEIGMIDYDLPFKVPAGGVETPRLPVEWNNKGGFGLIRDALGGTLKLDARANVSVSIGAWKETVWYEAKGLGAKVRF